MLAYLKTGPHHGAQLMEIPKPKIKRPDEVLVKVEACGICGTDLHLYEMSHGAEKMLTKYPIVFGHEVAGIVEEVGSAVRELKPGDYVCCDTRKGCGQCYLCRTGHYNHCKTEPRLGFDRDGGYAEYMSMPASFAYPLDKKTDLIEAAVLEPCGVAVRVMENISVRPGDSVAIIGPGPIGQMIAFFVQQITRTKTVIVGLPIDSKRLESAQSLGATPYMTTGKDDPAVLRSMTYSKAGFDFVIDTSGTQGGIDTAFDIAQIGGTVSIFGLGGDAHIPNDIIVEKELTVQGSWRRNDSTWYRSTYILANKGINLRRFISHVMPLRDIEKAFQMLLTRPHPKLSLPLEIR